MEKTIQYFLMLIPIIGVGVSIGIFQERISSQGETIRKITDVISSFSVIEFHLKQIDQRLNRIEYGEDYLSSVGSEEEIWFAKN